MACRAVVWRAIEIVGRIRVSGIVQALEDNGDYYYVNPGSVSIPKNGNENSYMVYEEHKIVLKNLYGEEISCLELG